MSTNSISDLKDYLQGTLGGYTQADADSLNELEALMNNMGAYRGSNPLPTDDGSYFDGSYTSCSSYTPSTFPYPNTEKSYADFKDYADANLPAQTCSGNADTTAWCEARTQCGCNARTNCDCVSRTGCGCYARTGSCGCNGRTDQCSCHVRYEGCGCYMRSGTGYSCSGGYPTSGPNWYSCSAACNGRACSCERRSGCGCYSRGGYSTTSCIGNVGAYCGARTACSCHGRCACNVVDSFL